MKKPYSTVLSAAVFFTLFISQFVMASAQIQPPIVMEMDDKLTATVLENGDMQVKEVISFSAVAYKSFKQRYPELSMLARVFKSTRMDAEYVNLDIKMDDLNNRVTATYTVKGAAVNKKGNFELTVAPEGTKVSLSAQTGNTLVFTLATTVSAEERSVVTSTVTLPEKAKNAKFDSSTNKITYDLAQPSAPSGIMQGNIVFLGAGVACIAVAGINGVLGKKKRMPPPPPPPTPSTSTTQPR